MTVVVLRAGDGERQRVRRRRTLLFDERAVRVARAADERAELAALADERPLAALGADLALAGLGGDSSPGNGRDSLCSGKSEQARNRPFRPSRMTIGWPSEQSSSLGSVVTSLRLTFLRTSATWSLSGPKNARSSGTHSR